MEILFRGKNTKGEWVEGSLVTTNNFIRQRPKQHTKHWIVETAFGNGGWFSVQRRQYVKTDTIEMNILNRWIPINEIGASVFHTMHCKNKIKIQEN